MISAILGGGLIAQIVLFFMVSFVLLLFTRPVAMKYFNGNKIRTNYEDAIDKTVRITERVDNTGGTGKAVLNGQEWTVRMQKAHMVLEQGALARVAAVEGVKLILTPLEEDLYTK